MMGAAKTAIIAAQPMGTSWTTIVTIELILTNREQLGKLSLVKFGL